MAFDFLDGIFQDDKSPSVNLQGHQRFVAQFYQTPTSPRSTVMLYHPDNLLPVSPAGDRYRSQDEPPAFEMSFVFPRESLLVSNQLTRLSESSVAEAEAAVKAATEKLTDPQASENTRINLRAVAHEVEKLNDKIKKARRSKIKSNLRKERAKLIDDFKQTLGQEGGQVTPTSGAVYLDTRDPKQRALAEQWSKLKGVGGLEVRHFERSDRTIEAQAVHEREKAQASDRALREVTDSLRRLERIPALTFTVPPAEVTLKLQKILFDGNLTQQGYQVEHWGEALDVLSVSGRTGGFYTTVGTGQGGLTNQLRRGSRAFQELMALVSFYRNNGYIYHTLGGNAGQVNVPAALIKIQFGEHIFIGRFDEFSMDETDDQPFSLSYSFTFTSFVTYLHGTDSSSAGQFRSEATPRTPDGPADTITEGTV